MKMHTSKSELTISSENLLDVLELTDSDLVQVQGTGGNGFDSRQSHNNQESHNCNHGRLRYHHHGYVFHQSHFGGYGSNNGYNSCGSNHGYNGCGSNHSYNGCGSNNGCNSWDNR